MVRNEDSLSATDAELVVFTGLWTIRTSSQIITFMMRTSTLVTLTNKAKSLLGGR